MNPHLLLPSIYVHHNQSVPSYSWPFDWLQNRPICPFKTSFITNYKITKQLFQLLLALSYDQNKQDFNEKYKKYKDS